MLPDAVDLHWRSLPPLQRDPGKRRSLYLTMRDGARIAIDVHLPSRLQSGAQLPTIVRQTRYFRSVEILRGLDFRFTRDAVDIAAPTRERFLARGYAWVDVDVRGSGVSSGSWPLPWAPDEVRDGAEVVDFIVSQPWSNGLVGSTGISYDGTTAEMLLCNQHPAVRAVAPRFSLFCAYEDVAFPGGAHLTWFTERWARFNRLLDAHRFHEAMAELVHVIARARANEPERSAAPLKLLLDRVGPARTKRVIAAAMGAVFRGGRRVDDDPEGSERARSLLDHVQNGDIHALCLEATFRDDTQTGSDELTFATVSPRTNLSKIAGSGAAIYSYGGFLDGAYGQSAARRFNSVKGGRLLLGPWGHAGVIAHEPHGKSKSATFAHDAELLRFFDLHLKHEDDGFGSEAAVSYFTLGENRWRTSSTWPPEGTCFERLYLSESRTLTPEPSISETACVTAHASDFGTGERSRWRGVLAAFVPADYPDIALRTRDQLKFESQPLAEPKRLTGHPAVHLFVRSHSGDFVVMAYLLDVSPSGEVQYVSEGQLRALHRRESEPEPGFVPLTPCRSFLGADRAPASAGETMRLSFGLLPTSYAFPAGHRLRLVITLGDRDHFACIGNDNAEIAIFTSALAASFLELPFS